MLLFVLFMAFIAGTFVVIGKTSFRKLRRLMWAIINIILINFRQKII